MVENEFFILHLRSGVHDLQALVNYLENREGVGYEEYSYSQARLQQVVKRLQELEKFYSKRLDPDMLQAQAQWVN